MALKGDVPFVPSVAVATSLDHLGAVVVFVTYVQLPELSAVVSPM